MKKMLYVCEADSGGIMEYAIRQSAAIACEGVKVHFLCKPSFPLARLAGGLVVETFAPETKPRWAIGRIGTIWKMTLEQRRKARRVLELATNLTQQFPTGDQVPATHNGSAIVKIVVLFACYKEYFSPFWVGPLRRLARNGATIGTIAHDPVRDFVVGPKWWHRWSVSLGYSFVRDIFVHDNTPVDFGGHKPKQIRIHEIPHGPYELGLTKTGHDVTRKKYGFAEDASDIVCLSFGQIRDGKNLDLILKAMTHLPKNVKLLVAGSGGSASSKPPPFYQKLAEKLGVSERCAWDIRMIPDDEVADLFAACDLVLLTYSAKFRSASGVLQAAVWARKPVVASSGEGPLKSLVEKYGLGVWVQPDREDAILAGFRSISANPPRADWGAYLRDNSWERNAEVVIRALNHC